ncbi:hypothetical protein PQX77_021823 [Marasmius sp. AFHP31]|nr:hypothetical protein PQX77_021823 [Marasmius sp. AFHP31]
MPALLTNIPPVKTVAKRVARLLTSIPRLLTASIMATSVTRSRRSRASHDRRHNSVPPTPTRQPHNPSEPFEGPGHSLGEPPSGGPPGGPPGDDTGPASVIDPNSQPALPNHPSSHSSGYPSDDSSSDDEPSPRPSHHDSSPLPSHRGSPQVSPNPSQPQRLSPGRVQHLMEGIYVPPSEEDFPKRQREQTPVTPPPQFFPPSTPLIGSSRFARRNAYVDLRSPYNPPPQYSATPYNNEIITQSTPHASSSRNIYPDPSFSTFSCPRRHAQLMSNQWMTVHRNSPLTPPATGTTQASHSTSPRVYGTAEDAVNELARRIRRFLRHMGVTRAESMTASELIREVRWLAEAREDDIRDEFAEYLQDQYHRTDLSNLYTRSMHPDIVSGLNELPPPMLSI